ncbi:hypothetical protein ABEY59_05485 [Bacillus albus]|uniref:hypothetical protein n=1 Tax=Bacillus albus TaxID=2026189 RepID=UPI003D251C80
MSNYKKKFEMKFGKEKKFCVHSNEHTYKIALKKDNKENIVEWNPSKNTILKVGIGIGAFAASWLSDFF